MASAASRAGRHALREAALIAAKKASMKGIESTGAKMLIDQVDMYDKGVIDQGVSMLPWDTDTDNVFLGAGNEVIGEQVGLLKYIQDKTVQPWIDLAKRGYGELNRKHDAGLLAKRDGPRRGSAGGRPSQVNKRQEKNV